MSLNTIISPLEKKFYLELKETIDRWVNRCIKDIKSGYSVSSEPHITKAYQTLHGANLTGEELEALENVLKKVVSGFLHSMFVSIDGGTSLSDKGKALELIDLKTGKPLTEGALHENFGEIIYED